MTSEPRDASFLARWARRKRAAALPQAAPEPPPPAPPESEESRAARAAELEARLAALPRLEEIGPGTDVSAFLQDFVPHALRNAALRRVWGSDPRITGFVEVADYQLDWNTPGGAPGYGPLEPDFDTEAAVRRIFREEAREEEPERDRLSQGGGAEADAAASHAAPQHDLAPETPVSAPAPTTKVVEEDPEAAATAAAAGGAAQQSPRRERGEPRLPRPRHGGALPGTARPSP